MNFNPFSGKGHWFKGNLHSHSTLSDGACSPQELKEIYQKEGYSFIAFTEHDVFADVSSLSDASFLALLGAEIKSYPALGNSAAELSCGDHRAYHMLCLPQPGAAASPIQVGERISVRTAGPGSHHRDTQDLIDHMAARGCLVTINHPIWTRLLPEDLLSLDRFFALEIYNTQCSFEGCDMGEGTLYWDMLLRQGKRIWGFAADDNHNKDDLCKAHPIKITPAHPHWSSCKAWIMVYAEALTPEAILDALDRGAFYSSTGPEIFRYELVDGELAVDCSEVFRIDFITYERRGHSFQNYNGLRSARYRLRGGENYVRVQCVDRCGRCAWTNPIFLK